MSGCCDPRGCNDLFGPGFARRQARRYRKRGLDATAQRMVAFLAERGIGGATVLEIGGGVGEIQLELLRRGASHATNLELVEGYDESARALAAEAGMSGRVSRRLLDIAVTPDQVEPADVVVLHRVVCCYPDYERLLTAAADHARHLLVFSHPRRNTISRTLLATQNALFRLTGRSFRAFAHPPLAMLETLSRRGLRPTYRHPGPVWQVAGLERDA
jgi:2-polyprenyl-3-methyl-5-hydroxy-6-metoxy-1,4-benzoquinol methylase